MARKWFQLVGEDGNALTSAAAVIVDIEDVDTLRDAVFAKVSRALPATVIAADLTVFDPNGVALPKSWSSVKEYGNDGENALIVQVPHRAEIAPSYFILPETREKVAKAVFVIVEEDKDDKGVGMGVKGVGMGVFFSATLAVTCDHNLTQQDTVGSSVSLALEDEMADVHR
ncbi:unnamed protein product [Phytophthora lilii]|uniref:Unnamed protein product n=1 Tax=Phytophthora lilii TaxID=2077276 RepID=A0A9W6XIN4_9STRA|nr:unnamed protein product [Phytophthora lilii]